MSTFDCTESRVAPVVDTILATTNTLAVLWNLGQQVRTPELNTRLGLGLGLVALWGGSAASGYSDTRECRQATAALDAHAGTASPSRCARDIDCKGARVCSAGACTDPTAATDQ
jgi:hypothetical protein